MRKKDNPEKVMSVMEHIREMRNGILISLSAFLLLSVVAFIFSNSIIQIFTMPFAGVDSSVDKKLVVTNIIEGFAVGYESSVVTAIVLGVAVVASAMVYTGTNPICIAYGVAMCGT